MEKIYIAPPSAKLRKYMYPLLCIYLSQIPFSTGSLGALSLSCFLPLCPGSLDPLSSRPYVTRSFKSILPLSSEQCSSFLLNPLPFLVKHFFFFCFVSSAHENHKVEKWRHSGPSLPTYPTTGITTHITTKMAATSRDTRFAILYSTGQVFSLFPMIGLQSFANNNHVPWTMYFSILRSPSADPSLFFLWHGFQPFLHQPCCTPQRFQRVVPPLKSSEVSIGSGDPQEQDSHVPYLGHWETCINTAKERLGTHI